MCIVKLQACFFFLLLSARYDPDIDGPVAPRAAAKARQAQADVDAEAEGEGEGAVSAKDVGAMYLVMRERVAKMEARVEERLNQVQRALHAVPAPPLTGGRWNPCCVRRCCLWPSRWISLCSRMWIRCVPESAALLLVMMSPPFAFAMLTIRTAGCCSRCEGELGKYGRRPGRQGCHGGQAGDLVPLPHYSACSLPIDAFVPLSAIDVCSKVMKSIVKSDSIGRFLDRAPAAPSSSAARAPSAPRLPAAGEAWN
jgi:hypothetical protein